MSREKKNNKPTTKNPSDFEDKSSSWLVPTHQLQHLFILTCTPEEEDCRDYTYTVATGKYSSGTGFHPKVILQEL